MKVLVTRAEEGATRLAERLRAAGLEPVVCPLVRVERIATGPVDLSRYDWLILTSRIAAREACRCLQGPWPRVAAVGPGTAEALVACGVEPDIVAPEPSQEGLLAVLPSAPGRVLFAGAAGARDLIVRTLGADRLDLYRTVECPPRVLPPCDLAAVASPSAARALARCAPALPAVSIGRTTTEAARAAGVVVVAEADRSDLDGFVEAIERGARALADSARASRATDGEGRT